jgi:type I restriction enzyme S subunit
VTLPEGWADARLGDVVELKYGKALPEKDRSSGAIAVYGSNGVVGSHTVSITAGKTIIVGRKGSAGKVHVSSVACFPIDTTYYVDEFSSLKAGFAAILFNSLDLDKLDRATAVPGLNREDAYRLNVTIPPLPEQRRIVAKLDALTARLARARAELDRVANLVVILREKTLSNASVEAQNSFGVQPVSYFINSLDQGWSPKCENYASLSSEEWAVLKTTAVQPLRYLEHENKVLPNALEARYDLEVTVGDILVTRAGPRVRVGISCVVTKTRPRLIIADKIYRLRCNPKRSVPNYLTLMLNSPEALRQIEKMKTGISDSGLNLTQDKFLSLNLPAAELSDQQKIVAKVLSAFTRADRLEAEAARARALLDRLEAAILAKAFRGELVPQNPADEPASLLLGRIRRQRETTPKPARPRRPI